MGDNLMFEKAWHDSSLMEIRVVAASDLVCACQTCYIGFEEAREKGRVLEEYDPHEAGESIVKFGRKEEGFTPGFSMGLIPAGGRDVRIEMDMEVNDGGGPSRHRCCFCLLCTKEKLSGLGRGLAALADQPVGSACSLLSGDEIGLSFSLRPREHLVPLNTMNIVLPYSFVSGAARLSWSDMLLGLRSGYLSPSAAIEHAVSELQEDSPQAILDLAIMDAWAVEPSTVEHIIEKLARAEEPRQKEESFDKLNYLILKWLFENGGPCEDFQAVECIYEDFYHPVAMRSFVEYEVSSLNPLHIHPDECLESIMRTNWANYLEGR